MGVWISMRVELTSLADPWVVPECNSTLNPKSLEPRTENTVSESERKKSVKSRDSPNFARQWCPRQRHRKYCVRSKFARKQEPS